MASTDDLFSKAVQHHRYGNLAEEEKCYRQVVEQDPGHADAWNFIGFLSLQSGRAQEGLRCITQAITLDPSKAVYHANLSLANRAVGNLPEAARCIQEAKRLGLEEPMGYNSLGIRFMNQGNPSAAAACFEMALEIKPDYADGYYNLGIALNAMGHGNHAITAYERALRIKPDFVEAYNNLGDLLVQLDRLDEAIIHLESALRYKPDHDKAYYNLGRACQKKQDFDKAEACFRQVLRIRPDHAKAHQQLGTILEKKGQINEANRHFTEATQIKPESSESRINAGISCLERAQFEEAVEHFQSALKTHPNHAMALLYLGDAYKRLGRLEDAIEKYREVTRLQPSLANAYYQLGDALANYGDCNESAVVLEIALKLDPGHYRACGRLADCLERQGRYSDALARFDQAIRMDPLDPGLKIRRAMALPVILESSDQVGKCMDKLNTELDALGNDLDTVEDPYRYLGHRPFFVSHLGPDDRSLLEKIARLQVRVAPGLNYQAPHCQGPPAAIAGRRLRVGFLSKYFRHHLIGRMFAGMLGQLDRDRFEVFALTFPHRRDEWTDRVQSGADHTVIMPDSYRVAREMIAQQQLDVLLYTDIGMDRLTYNLAFARLAPVQCVTWGHPVTSAIPAVDYFISSRRLESEEAQRWYTEKLVLLDDLPMYFYRPLPRGEAKSREELGLPADATIYACPQNLFKLHPDFDSTIGQILRRDPRGCLVLMHGVSRHWDELLVTRYRRTIADVADRILFVRRPDAADFSNFLARCDVVLDPFPFGGGLATFDALAAGTPVATCPGPLLRSRTTAGCYQQMDLRDLIAHNAEQYAEMAVGWGTDPQSRQNASRRILDAADRLFDQESAVRQLEDFFRSRFASDTARDHRR